MAERVHGTACRACGNRAPNTTLRAREMMVGRRDTFDDVRCATVLFSIDPHLDDEGTSGSLVLRRLERDDLMGRWDLLMFNHSLEQGRTDAAGFVLVAIEGAA